MARFLYGATAASYVTAPNGRPLPGAALPVYNHDQTEQLTDLLNHLGQPVTMATADDTGLLRVYLPDEYDLTAWVRLPDGTFLAIWPVNLPRPAITGVTAELGDEPAAVIDGDEVSGYSLAFTLPSVITRTVLSGDGPPADDFGGNGDYYVDAASIVWWGPKADDAWPEVGTPMVGPSGGPVPSLEDVPANRVMRTIGGEGVAWDIEIDPSAVVPAARFMKDTATMTATNDLRLTLGATPLPYSVTVTLNGLVLAEGVDYEVTGNDVLIGYIDPGLVTVQYGYDADLEPNPASATTDAWLVWDDFNRADNAASLGSAVTGQSWVTYLGSTWGIEGNQAIKTANGTSSSGNGSRDAVTVESGKANVELDVIFNGVAGLAVGGLVFRLSTNTNNCLFTTTSGLYRLNNGAETKLTGFSKAIAPGDRVRVRCDGPQITVFKQTAASGPFVQIATVSEAFNQTATKHGLRTSATGAVPAVKYDLFRVREVLAT